MRPYQRVPIQMHPFTVTLSISEDVVTLFADEYCVTDQAVVIPRTERRRRYRRFRQQ